MQHREFCGFYKLCLILGQYEVLIERFKSEEESFLLVVAAISNLTFLETASTTYLRDCRTVSYLIDVVQQEDRQFSVFVLDHVSYRISRNWQTKKKIYEHLFLHQNLKTCSRSPQFSRTWQALSHVATKFYNAAGLTFSSSFCNDDLAFLLGKWIPPLWSQLVNGSSKSPQLP